MIFLVRSKIIWDYKEKKKKEIERRFYRHEDGPLTILGTFM